jgi:hypothetical protein
LNRCFRSVIPSSSIQGLICTSNEGIKCPKSGKIGVFMLAPTIFLGKWNNYAFYIVIDHVMSRAFILLRRLPLTLRQSPSPDDPYSSTSKAEFCRNGHVSAIIEKGPVLLDKSGCHPGNWHPFCATVRFQVLTVMSVRRQYWARFGPYKHQCAVTSNSFYARPRLCV